MMKNLQTELNGNAVTNTYSEQEGELIMKLIVKMGNRIPELLVRAATGDLWAIGILALMGISVIRSMAKDAERPDN